MNKLITLALFAVLVGAGAAQAEAPRDAPALDLLQTKIPPPRPPNDGCYYGVRCFQSQRYGQICYRVFCQPNLLITR